MGLSRKAFYQAASSRADRIDRAWFSRRPAAFLRLRSSIAFEEESWDERSHHILPFVLVMKEDDGRFRRRAFYAHKIPDHNPVVLAVLMDLLEEGVPTVEGDPLAPIDPILRQETTAKISGLRHRFEVAQAKLRSLGGRGVCLS